MTPATATNMANDKLGAAPAIASDCFAPCTIFILKFEAEKVTLEVAWKVSVPNWTIPR